MNWNERFSKGSQPWPAQISAHIASPLWEELCGYLERTYGVAPSVEHSACSGAPGWNVKYKKSGRSLCTLYPGERFFTCMVSIGGREAMEAELMLATCTDHVRDLYWKSNPLNGGRWLMIKARSPEILADIKALIGTRVKPKRTAKA